VFTSVFYTENDNMNLFQVQTIVERLEKSSIIDKRGRRRRRRHPPMNLFYEGPAPPLEKKKQAGRPADNQ